MTKPLPPIWAKPNGKSGVVMALREANLWRQREKAFRSRHAKGAAAYARSQQRWWIGEARLCALGPRTCDAEFSDWLSHPVALPS